MQPSVFVQRWLRTCKFIQKYGLLWLLWLSGKEPSCQCKRHGFDPWSGKISWKRKWQPTLGFFFLIIIFNWKIIALQYFVGFCHTSTWISHRHTYVPSLLNLSPTPNPILPFTWGALQQSCLGNPMDKGAWQAADHEVGKELDVT